MPEIELILTAKGGERLKTTISDIQNSLAAARKELEEFVKTEKKAFTDVAEVDAYDKKLVELNETITDGKKVLDDYDKALDEVDEQSKNVTKSTGLTAKSLFKMIGGITAVVTVVNALKNAFKSTETGLKTFNVIGAITKQILYDIVTLSKRPASESMKAALTYVKAMEKLRQEQRVELPKLAKEQAAYDQVMLAAADQTKSNTKQLQLYDQAMLEHEVIMGKKIANAEAELAAIEIGLIARPKETTLIDARIAKETELAALQGESATSMKRLQTQRTAILKEGIDAANELLDKYSGTAINKLFGIDKISAERDWALKELRDYQTELIGKLGSLTPEQQKMIQEMADEIWLVALKEMNQTGRADTGNLKSRFANWADILFPDMKKIKTDIQEYGGTLAKDKNTFWDILGIDPESEEGQKVIDNLKIFADSIKGILTSITDRMVEDAQRRRELLDQQITETQNALELEAGLMEEGYANNLTAKRKELDQLKKQRAEALADEEKALKVQRQLDTAVQISSLITATASILKGWSEIPLIGHILAIAAIAAMFTTFGIAKAKAASLTKLAEGGTGTDTGIITGKSHSAGGEHFLSHVEVERGERWGVLNKKASEKFGKTFDHIVSSFNKDQMPTFGTPEYSNSVMVNNDGSNSRLDKVIAEQKKLNNQFGKDQILITGHRKVVTKGKNIRIVG